MLTIEALRNTANKNIKILSQGPYEAELCVNLTNLFYNYDFDNEKFDELKRGFNLLFEKGEGTFLWEDTLDAAIQSLSVEEAQIIRQSPANACMRKAFVEIVKNSCDEQIMHQLKHPSENDLRARISLNIDTSIAGQISMTVTDHGQGFSQSFLNQVSSRELREEYMLTCGSEKQISPLLFGGRGRGLRNLIANVEHGAELEQTGVLKRKYDKDDFIPLDSSLTLANKKDSNGINITITMPASPIQLCLGKIEDDSEPLLDAPPKRPWYQKNKKSNLAIQETQVDMKEQLAEMKRNSPQSVANDLDSPSDKKLSGF